MDLVLCFLFGFVFALLLFVVILFRFEIACLGELWGGYCFDVLFCLGLRVWVLVLFCGYLCFTDWLWVLSWLCRCLWLVVDELPFVSFICGFVIGLVVGFVDFVFLWWVFLGSL